MTTTTNTTTDRNAQIAETIARNMQIAETILDQIGGSRRVAMMTGAREFVATKNGVQFSIKAPAGKPNKVRITLDASDTYTVEGFRISGVNVKALASRSDVYAENLIGVLESMTGLYFRL